MSSPTATYSYSDFREWAFDGDFIELIEGRPWHRRMAPGPVHQVVVDNLQALLQPGAARAHSPLLTGGLVWLTAAPGTDAAADTVVRPDLCLARDPAQVDGHGCIGAPDWVIEVLAAGSTAHDLKTKFDLYQRYGVAEYWLVTPELRCIIAYVLRAGQYQLQGEYAGPSAVPVQTWPGVAVSWADVFTGV
ncbi:Uma2 family endonuclease [Hymenobacter jeollabukensis]|uniref:Uma2 family endonuclease n=1 Tax=Hymenobacter jeollabukensis TaxID=2025313 RepID=A0A5R8WIZ4_9BACT|nr:Uma2 family endonuclease [Hymenobacter jeollabukensis]TLM88720.1 Uma2 family endonuclease [Hymenobacter jeollabukensis]